MLLCTFRRSANDTLLLHSVNKYIPSGILVAILAVIHFFLEQYVEKGKEKEKPTVIDDSNLSILFVSRARD